MPTSHRCDDFVWLAGPWKGVCLATVFVEKQFTAILNLVIAVHASLHLRFRGKNEGWVRTARGTDYIEGAVAGFRVFEAWRITPRLLIRSSASTSLMISLKGPAKRPHQCEPSGSWKPAENERITRVSFREQHYIIVCMLGWHGSSDP